MSDDRPSARHRDWAGLEPARVDAGELDSDDGARGDATPVESVSRRRGKVPSVEVDASAFDVDVRWREFDQMRESVRLCNEEHMARTRRRKWLYGVASGLGSVLVTVLVWAVTKLDARADANAEERLRRQMLLRHETEIRVLQDWRIRAETLLGLRAVPPNP